MNNLIISFKRFLKNKNTVTIIGVVAIIAVLYFAYNRAVTTATNPQEVPYAVETIQPKTEITKDMVDMIKVPSISVQKNVYTSKAQVVGMYTNYNTIVPKGSLFYKEALVKKSDLPDDVLSNLEKNEIPYNFSVTMATTYANSIMPNNYIDIYMKAVNEEGTLMVGRLIENVKVLAVRDSQGKNVFENSEETRTPAWLIFGLNEELNFLLRKASYMNSFSVVLFPVPHGINGVTEAEGATVVSSQTLKDFINANTVPNDELVDQTETPQGE